MTGTLPAQVREWADIDSDPILEIPPVDYDQAPNYVPACASICNDKLGETFAQIADRIEKYL